MNIKQFFARETIFGTCVDNVETLLQQNQKLQSAPINSTTANSLNSTFCTHSFDSLKAALNSIPRQIGQKIFEYYFCQITGAVYCYCLPEAGDIVTLPMKFVSLVVAYSSMLFPKLFHCLALPGAPLNHLLPFGRLASLEAMRLLLLLRLISWNVLPMVNFHPIFLTGMFVSVNAFVKLN